MVGYGAFASGGQDQGDWGEQFWSRDYSGHEGVREGVAAGGQSVGGMPLSPRLARLDFATLGRYADDVQLHPYNQQPAITQYCRDNKVALEAYCPLVRNQKSQDPTLTSIASKHGTSTQQVLLRYCLQKDWIPLPKSDNAGRIAKNADLYGFELDVEDMGKLDGLEQGGEGALVMAVDNEAVA